MDDLRRARVLTRERIAGTTTASPLDLDGLFYLPRSRCIRIARTRMVFAPRAAVSAFIAQISLAPPPARNHDSTLLEVDQFLRLLLVTWAQQQIAWERRIAAAFDACSEPGIACTSVRATRMGLQRNAETSTSPTAALPADVLQDGAGGKDDELLLSPGASGARSESLHSKINNSSAGLEASNADSALAPAAIIAAVRAHGRRGSTARMAPALASAASRQASTTPVQSASESRASGRRMSVAELMAPPASLRASAAASGALDFQTMAKRQRALSAREGGGGGGSASARPLDASPSSSGVGGLASSTPGWTSPTAGAPAVADVKVEKGESSSAAADGTINFEVASRDGVTSRPASRGSTASRPRSAQLTIRANRGASEAHDAIAFASRTGDPCRMLPLFTNRLGVDTVLVGAPVTADRYTPCLRPDDAVIVDVDAFADQKPLIANESDPGGSNTGGTDGSDEEALLDCGEYPLLSPVPSSALDAPALLALSAALANTEAPPTDAAPASASATASLKSMSASGAALASVRPLDDTVPPAVAVEPSALLPTDRRFGARRASISDGSRIAVRRGAGVQATPGSSAAAMAGDEIESDTTTTKVAQVPSLGDSLTALAAEEVSHTRIAEAAARSRRRITLQAVTALLADTDPWIPPAAVSRMYEHARWRLEEAAWNLKCAGWRRGTLVGVAGKVWYNPRTGEVAESSTLPALTREAVTSLDWTSFQEMCLRHGLLRFGSTGLAAAGAAMEAEAAVTIQRGWRRWRLARQARAARASAEAMTDGQTLEPAHQAAHLPVAPAQAIGGGAERPSGRRSSITEMVSAQMTAFRLKGRAARARSESPAGRGGGLPSSVRLAAEGAAAENVSGSGKDGMGMRVHGRALLQVAVAVTVSPGTARGPSDSTSSSL